MCGITGFFSPTGFEFADAKVTLACMRDRLLHRGPDDAGSWLDAEAGIALGHRRLSILDTSLAGHQPMISDSGRYVLVFNGEIYNHRVIRRQLESLGPVAWRGHSDTETLLTAVERWGLVRTLKTSVGMFALALWDRQERLLAIARDRFGEKPLYYGWLGQTFVFASEIKAIKCYPEFQAKINLKTIPAFLSLGYIPGPESIWEGIYKLEPGHITWIYPERDRWSAKKESYWSLKEVFLSGQQNPFSGSRLEATDALEFKLMAAVQQQMISDVPLGVLLSGGIDSSIVTALAQSGSSAQINTFSIGFEAASHNEAHHAKRIAGYLGTRHHEYYVSARDAQTVIPDLADIYDEPFADSSQIPTLLLSRKTASCVKVVLTGDGGDELFAGYSRYFHIAKQYDLFKSIPITARKGVAMLIRKLRLLAPHSQRLRKLTSVLAAQPLESMYRVYQSMNHVTLTTIDDDYAPYFMNHAHWPEVDDYISWMMCADTKTYLPDDLLVKLDRASMSASLEARAPFLSHEIYEFCWSLPPSLKYHDGASKLLLKDVLRRHLPTELFDRPKMGFAIPIAQWLREDLQEYANTYLNWATLTSTGFLDASVITGMWQQHQRGESDFSATLWNIIILVSWMDRNGLLSHKR
jgi:asparagine synthase (glutamine-hydrolysing)